MSDISNKESKGDIKDKLESIDLSNISIYSIDRDLEIGDIVYGYLTNPFKAKIDIIKPNYPFKVIGKSETELFLLGQCSVFSVTYQEIFEKNLSDFYVYFLHNNESYKFDAHMLENFDMNSYILPNNIDPYCLNNIHIVSGKLNIRKENYYWIGGGIGSEYLCFKYGLLSFGKEDDKAGIVPFVTVPIKKR